MTKKFFIGLFANLILANASIETKQIGLTIPPNVLVRADRIINRDRLPVGIQERNR